MASPCLIWCNECSARAVAAGLLAPKLGSDAAWRAVGDALRGLVETGGQRVATFRCSACAESPAGEGPAFHSFADFARHLSDQHERSAGLLDGEQCFRCAQLVRGAG